ncbi:VOC family protein [Amnibacterium flavum]|uniref:VOC family protein n=1 Tax=Amnibacterium flavum TaxID=2173173 RepID=UPI0014029286|nr:VOC family protein [Amnibacterium flavum]
MSGTRIVGLLHAAFIVKDIDVSVDWYTRVLGLQLVHRQRGDNDYTRTLVGVEDAVLEVAQFRVPGASDGISTHMLELIQYVTGAIQSSEAAPPVNRVGAAHVAFVVTDLGLLHRQMLTAGAQFVNSPVIVTEGANRGASACYLRDPDGNVLELMQFDESRAERLGILSTSSHG